MFAKLITAASCLALAAAATGCVVVDDEPTPSSAYGTLTAQWTLDGSSSPSSCGYYNVDSVDVAIYDGRGDYVTAAQPYCEDFGVSFDLPTGAYSAELTLLDAGGYAVSDVVAVDVDVFRNDETVIDANFPGAIIY